MSDCILTRPGADQAETVCVGPDCRLVLAFDQNKAVLGKENQDLVFVFGDGGRLHLEGFYDNFNDKARSPIVEVDGFEFPGEVFLAALNDSSLMPTGTPEQD